MERYQGTVHEKVDFQGIGLHTGQTTHVSILPAESNHGIVFQRIDLPNKPKIPALVDFVINTERSTVIGLEDASVSTIEHLMASLAALSIDNVLIELNGPEVPILDGSAKFFMEGLQKSGRKTQNSLRNYLKIDEKLTLNHEIKDSLLTISPASNYTVKSTINFSKTILENQSATLEDLSQFSKEIAPCRTFVFLHELELLLEHNLVKGGDLENAIVIVDKKPSLPTHKKLEEVFGKEIPIQELEQGVLNNVDLCFENEPARHKLLDLIGDLYLLGMPIIGKIEVYKPGHESNVKFAGDIKQMLKENKAKPVTMAYDITKEPIKDINAIRNLLPHKYPFLMVDRIIEMEEDKIVGIKNITINEQLFTGHFPEEPVFPGVLIMEALAQCGGILVLSQVDDPENYVTYFLKIDKAKFKRKVVPGDVLILEMRLTQQLRHGIVEMEGKAFVGTNVVAQAVLTAQVTKK